MPSISVAMATYNGATFLREQLDSIISQELPAAEIVCVDDGSSDATLDILHQYSKSSPIPLRIVEHQVNQGVTATFSNALSLVTGDYVALADQDDVWLPEKLKKLHQSLEERQWDAVFSDANLVDQDRKPLGYRLLANSRLEGAGLKAALEGNLFSQLLRFNVVTGATLMVRRSVLSRALPIPAEWLHDYWIALVTAATGRIGLCNAPLIEYRQHGKNQIGMRQGLDREIKSATHKSHAAYLAERDLFRTLNVRLEDLEVSSEYMNDLGGKIQFLESRYLLREKPLRRLPLVAENILKSRYFRYGQGLKPLLKDLWLP